MDGISEPSLKTECSVSHGMCQCLDELIKSWYLHLNQIMIYRTSVCKYESAKVDSNINPACSASL